MRIDSRVACRAAPSESYLDGNVEIRSTSRLTRLTRSDAPLSRILESALDSRCIRARRSAFRAKLGGGGGLDVYAERLCVPRKRETMDYDGGEGRGERDGEKERSLS